MARYDDSGGVSALVRHTAGMAELAISAGHPDRKHYEYLPYPDNIFIDDTDARFVLGDKFTIGHVFYRSPFAFVPGVPVRIKSIDAERSSGFSEFLNPYVYCITATHGPYEWTVYKRYRHFHDLHKALVQFLEAETRRSISDLNGGFSRWTMRNDAVKFISQRSPQDEESEYPCFPTRNDRIALINDDLIGERCQILREYLNNVLRHQKYRHHAAMREFFNISYLTFVYGLSPSEREGYLLKLSNDDHRGRSFIFRFRFLRNLCNFNQGKRWFVLKDSYIIYIRPNTNEIGFPMLVDRGFQMYTGFRHTRAKNAVKIVNLQRSFVMKCRNANEHIEWIQHFKSMQEKASMFLMTNRFNSFAPIRKKQLGSWFINGKPYMKAVAKALLEAKEEVFITDWWLSPEILLKRPCEDESYRLDNLLGRIADNGVRVYVLIFKEVSFAMNLNSLHSKRALIGKSKNGFIKVIRHPDHYPAGGVFLWSHHEKLVIIDQKIAFVGGIDLCFGRWDDEHMRLVDLGNKNLMVSKENTATVRNRRGSIEAIREGLVRVMADIEHEKLAKENRTNTNNEITTMDSSANKTDNNATRTNLGVDEQFELPTKLATRKWIEVKLAIHKPTKIIPEKQQHTTDDNENVVKTPDLSHPNDLKTSNEMNETQDHPQPNAKGWKRLANKIKKTESRQREEEEEDEEKPEEPQQIPEPKKKAENRHLLFIGKDYSNAYERDFVDVQNYSEDYIDRTTVPRMPWHDEAVVVMGESARDLARHFIQRWNIHKYEKFRENDSYPFLLPKTYEDPEELLVNYWNKFLDSPPFKIDVQCLRSVGPWSIGTDTVETSIQNAYLQLIDAAKHYIYIENQFFITNYGDNRVTNQISNALYRRISRAHSMNEKFRIYIVLPLLPGFDNVNAVQAVLYFSMSSICKGENSLFKRLEKDGVPVDEYISFYGMRRYDFLRGLLVTEIIYVHSKLMIVDDRFAICGSANINDRSLVGNRDSEVCVVISDCEETNGVFDGQQARIGKFCSSWRKRLFGMLLGISPDDPQPILDLNDPTSDEFYNGTKNIARKNTKLYEEVFATLPTDQVRTYMDVTDYTKGPHLYMVDHPLAEKKLKDIQGFIVQYPLYFLNDENYLPSLRTPEGLVPNAMWT